MSSSELASVNPSSMEPARFTLWPMPELGAGTPLGVSHFQGVAAPLPEEAAYDRGVNDGRAAAHDEFVGEIERAVQALGGVAEQLGEERTAYARAMEDHVLTVAVAVARAVIQQEVTVDAAAIGGMIRRALAEVAWDVPIEVRLNPDDITAAEAHFATITSEAKPSQLEWVPDSHVERGGYLIDTPQRLVDGTLDTVLNSLREYMAND